MDLGSTESEQAFRESFSAWLDANLTDEWRESRLQTLDHDSAHALRRAWTRQLGEAGWLGVWWPKEHGGKGASLMERVIYFQEFRRHDAPQPADAVGLSLLGPTLIEVGTEAQKQRFLPRILRGETSWTQGFSEPNAGSDLASLQTRAELDGDEWVVNGQKIWSGAAQYANWCALLARTDPDAPKHRGISFLMVDMASPGVTVRPIKQITGDAEFNEMFFDNVRVPRENVVGEVHGGWKVAQRLLTYERGVMTMPMIDAWERLWTELRDHVRTATRRGQPLAADAIVREQLARTWADIQVMRLANLRHITWYQRGVPPREETSYMKLHWARVEQGVADLAMTLLGENGVRMPGAAGAIADGQWTRQYLHSMSATILGGTQDIQRNIIAERLFGLPR